MTKNGRRVNCYCSTYQCRGKEMDWRTRDRHDAKDVADRPLYPVDDEHHQQDEQINLHPEPLPTPPVAAQPYEEVPLEDIVSHVDSLPHCNDPIYETVSVQHDVCAFLLEKLHHIMYI